MTGERGTPRIALLWRVAVVVLIASGCGDDGVGSVSAGFRTHVKEVDFGRVLEGGEVTRQVPLVATGRSEVTVEVRTTGPFRAPETITVPGGGEVPLDVTFVAPDGDAEGTLTLSARGESFDIALRGRGVRPQPCVPSAPCRVARFVLETERCEESVADDGAACTPEGLCLENGVCRSGTCVGTPRTCDDGNACTQDACSPDVGCVHLDISAQCPQPSNPCEVATCHPMTGCGTAVREENAVCGPVDCVTANLCIAGTCTQVPTPEGFLCAPATPCQGEGYCSKGACVRPDAGTMSPSWSVTLGTAPAEFERERAGIVSLNGNIYFEACDLASRDGGCALLSYTGNGFQRFEEPLPGGGVLHAVTPTGVFVGADGTLWSFAASNGDPQWSIPLASLRTDEIPGGAEPVLPRDGLAVQADGGVLLAVSWRAGEGVDGGAEPSDAGTEADAGVPEDGGAPGDGGEPPDAGQPVGGEPLDGVTLAALAVTEDGGVQVGSQFLGEAGFGSGLAVGEGDRRWLWAPEQAVSVRAKDGGAEIVEVFPAQGLAGRSLSVASAGGWAFVGGESAIGLDGAVRNLLAPVAPGTGEASIDDELLSASDGFIFFRACRPPLGEPCADPERATVVRAFRLSDLSPVWETPILPGLADGQLIEAGLTGGPFLGGVITLTEARINGDWRTDVQLFLAGGRAMLCPIDGAPRVRSALFGNGFLYALVARGGQWRLEAYDLKGLPLLDTGWSRSSAASGHRRAR